MKIKVISRSAMVEEKNLNPRLLEDFKIISICDPLCRLKYGYSTDNDYGPLFEEHPNVCTIECHDIDYDMGEPYVLFSADHAKKVINFLRNLTLADDLIIHCFMGINRSGSCGFFANEMFRLDYEKFKRTNPQVIGNVHIHTTLVNTYQEMFGKPHIDFLGDN